MKTCSDILGVSELREAAASTIDKGNAKRPPRGSFIATRPATEADRKWALAMVAVSALIFLAAIPFARQQLAALDAFIPSYQSALVVCDLTTVAMLVGQARFSKLIAPFVLAGGYLFSASLATVHALSFPGLFAAHGLLGGGAQSTAWLYMFWHAGFPLFVIGYALAGATTVAPSQVGAGALALLAAVATLTWIATIGEPLLPAIMQGNHYTPTLIFVVSSVWLLSLAALLVLWHRRPHSVLDLWLMVVMCAWLFDIGLSAVFNAGRFDLGFYAGRIYGLAAASLVLVVLLFENASLQARLAHELERDQRTLARHAERLRILAAIDQAVIAEQPADAIAAAVIQPLRELLGVPRAIVNRLDLASGTVEWVAAAGRRRTHIGPGVRYGLSLMGDLGALKRGEPQLVETAALRPGPEIDALLASGVRWYLVVPMFAGAELVGAISFGGEASDFRPEQIAIAREVAAQLAIATAQTRLLERVKSHAVELEGRVRERTAELESFSYSVSHDLRAPLRAVDGYAQMLEEDYGRQLDTEARRLLGVIRGSARRMGQLIDDLLAFSRLGRQNLEMAPVDVASMVREVANELRGPKPVTLDYETLPPATADPALLRQVWANLIGNAIKYSSKKTEPRVVVSGSQGPDENIYSVRDNGAGFDMQYAAKLFGVFQRLHRSEEFEGTGVGLAIVQRIVGRHGGKVWAQGKRGEGATFFFSLPRRAP